MSRLGYVSRRPLQMLPMVGAFLVTFGVLMGIIAAARGVPVVLGKLWSDIGCSQGKSRTRHGILGGG